MAHAVSQVFLPGFAAHARLYADGLPDGWQAAQPPPPSVSQGSLANLREWAVSEIVGRPERTLVAGHSMGAALAILAAATAPDHVAGLVLIAPAGLPLRSRSAKARPISPTSSPRASTPSPTPSRVRASWRSHPGAPPGWSGPCDGSISAPR